MKQTINFSNQDIALSDLRDVLTAHAETISDEATREAAREVAANRGIEIRDLQQARDLVEAYDLVIEDEA